MARGDRQAWRIAKHTPEFHAADLSGGGAKDAGGRWNSKGKAVVYVSSTIALATLESLAQLNENVAIRNLFLVKINVPAALWRTRKVIEADNLDITWVAEPPSSTTIGFGDDWLDRAKAPLLFVPSVIVPEEYNILINPAHPATAEITAVVARQFVHDPRFYSARV